jgi:hypothetical protein
MMKIHRFHYLLVPAFALFLLLFTIAQPAMAAVNPGGDGGGSTPGSTNSTTYSTSTKTVLDTSYDTVTQRVNTYEVELIAMMQGGPTLYDQTISGALADAAVQAAIVEAKAALTSNGAVSFIGPTLLSTGTSLAGSASVIGDPVMTSSEFSAVTTAYIGPQTLLWGDNQSLTFEIPAGAIDYDTLLTTLVHQTVTTTTTDTYLTLDIYQLIGVIGQPPAPAPVPEPATMTLLGAGLFGLAGFRKKFRK